MWLRAMPEEILDLLSDPDAIARWSPVPFELIDIDGSRLRTGTRARVRGTLAGWGLEFDVRIRRSDHRCFSLLATGPVAIDARYVLRPRGDGTNVGAAVSVSGHGFLNGVLARATEALLSAGALRASLERLDGELESQTALLCA
ncbi:MAG: SRPBCC family protein [Actinomycetota bacterium]|nr:SRPBCC family protein [Actinomycetota bacterium]